MELGNQKQAWFKFFFALTGKPNNKFWIIQTLHTLLMISFTCVVLQLEKTNFMLTIYSRIYPCRQGLLISTTQIQIQLLVYTCCNMHPTLDKFKMDRMDKGPSVVVITPAPQQIVQGFSTANGNLSGCIRQINTIIKPPKPRTTIQWEKVQPVVCTYK